jgi:hypothetical protein
MFQDRPEIWRVQRPMRQNIAIFFDPIQCDLCSVTRCIILLEDSAQKVIFLIQFYYQSQCFDLIDVFVGFDHSFNELKLACVSQFDH